MVWISVKKYLPPLSSGWLIVRAINKDSAEFYFMALYRHRNNEWEFFRQEEPTMQVTHWCYPDAVREENAAANDWEIVG